MEPKKITRTNIAEHLVDYELAMVGKTRLEIIDDDRWYFNNTLTHEQYVAFRKYAIELIQKVFKINKKNAEGVFGWFNLAFGLRIKN